MNKKVVQIDTYDEVELWAGGLLQMRLIYKNGKLSIDSNHARSMLTGEDWEWDEYSPGLFQNKICPRVFKASTDNSAYDVTGIIFTDDSGMCWTSPDSIVYIAFPYTPNIIYVNVQQKREPGVITALKEEGIYNEQNS